MTRETKMERPALKLEMEVLQSGTNPPRYLLWKDVKGSAVDVANLHDENDASDIMRAVNSYSSMLTALKAVLTFGQEHTDLVRTAITKAEGGSL